MANTYTPRRAAKRWLAGAPEYILDVFDHPPYAADRYTVFLSGPYLYPQDGRTYANGRVSYLGMSSNPAHPQGVSQWGEMSAHEQSVYRRANARFRVAWSSLPEHIRAHVIARANPES